ncbi:auxin efflux carrier, partial [Dichotomocladium elegans]
WLSKLNMVFFTPCFLFSNISSVISYDKLLAFWPIPVFFVCFSTFSLLSSLLVNRLVGVKPKFRPFVVACTMFHNTNSLPIAVISSLAVSESGKVLCWGTDDTQEAVAARGITYAMLYAIFGNLLRWSYGYSLLQPSQPKVMDEEEHCSRSNRSMYRITSSTTALLFSTRPTQNNKNDSDDDKQASLKCARDGPRSRRSLAAMLASTAMALHEHMSAPLYAACLALVVGLAPPLKYLMYESFLYPILTSAIQDAAKASVPITLLGLGSQLNAFSRGDNSHQMMGQEVNTKAVATAIGIRMGLIPCIIIPAVAAFLKHGTRWSLVATDPVFGLMMIVLGCTPTAINLVQISQVTGAFEDEMLRVLFWSYAVICVPVFTAIVFVALSIVQYFM